LVKNPYFQFPLCALAFGQTEHERLNVIISYSVVQAGSRLFQKLSLEQQCQFLSRKEKAGQFPIGFDREYITQCAALYAADVMHIHYNNFKAVWEGYQQMEEYVLHFETRYGRDALVRIKADWAFAARNSRGLTYREFSVLCAIYSAIGNKKLARITRERIRRGALGYRNAAIMRAELPNRADKAQLLTERRLRDTIARLHQNKFFARCCACPPAFSTRKV